MTADKSPLIFETRLGMLSEVLEYFPESGCFIWKVRPSTMFDESVGKIIRSKEWAANKWNSRYAGKPALTKVLTGGYLGGSIFNRGVRAHRVAWAMFYGKWPEGEIDHINGNPADNRITNLRDVSHAVNMRNQRRYSNSSSGVIGVCWQANVSKWSAEIQCDGVREKLGFFVDFEDAVAARNEAALRLGFHPNHGRSDV